MLATKRITIIGSQALALVKLPVIRAVPAAEKSDSQGVGRYGRTLLLALTGGLVMAGGLLSLVSCKAEPFAASTRSVVTPDDDRYVRVLDKEQQKQIKAAFADLAAGHDSVSTPMPAAAGMRWSDVPLAVFYACDEVEMAITRTTEHDWGYQFDLLSIENWPGRLVMQRTDDERVYEAHATIGRFGDKTERAAMLLEAIEKKMRAFGRKPRIDE